MLESGFSFSLEPAAELRFNSGRGKWENKREVDPYAGDKAARRQGWRTKEARR
jgi:hypothetical protein